MMQQTASRRDFLASGAMGGILGLGASGRLVALEETQAESDQPEDAVGTAARAERLQSLIARLGDDPVVMLNLLKFKPGGEESYRRYGQEFAAPMQKYAPQTQVVFYARCEELLIGHEEWDRIILVRYPSMKAFAALTSSAEYGAIAHFRTQAIERAVLYALVPESPGA
jgi:uncharacterized protein (DUF1330 family)